MNAIEKPLVYVLILNWNSKNITIECIQSILKSDYPNFKLAVIDNNSSDNSVEAIREKFNDFVKIIESDQNLGYARGMNLGLNITNQENPHYFFILNNDTRLDPFAISELVKVSQKYNDNCLVTGKVYHYDQPKILQYIGAKIIDKKYLKMQRIGRDEEDKGQYDEESERDMIDDIFWLMPTKIYRKVGGYSNYFFMNGEQADLALRVVKSGHKLIYTPNAKIWHKGSLSTGGREANLKMKYWDMKSRMIFRYLHMQKKYFIILYFQVLINIIVSFIKGIIKLLLRKNFSLKVVYASFRGFLSFTCWIFTKREATSFNPF